MTNLEFGIDLAIDAAVKYAIESVKDAFGHLDKNEWPCADTAYSFTMESWFESENARLKTLLKFLPLDMPDRFGEEYDRLIDQ
jgi:hypothetical protein